MELYHILTTFLFQKFFANYSFLFGETRVALFTDESELFPTFCMWIASHSALAIDQKSRRVCFNILTEQAAASIPTSLSEV